MDHYEIRMIYMGMERDVGLVQADNPLSAIEESKNMGMLQLPFQDSAKIAVINSSGLTFFFDVSQAT